MSTKTGKMSKISKGFEEIVESEINLPCHQCGLTPSFSYDPSDRGKPICEFCYEAKVANGIIKVNGIIKEA